MSDKVLYDDFEDNSEDSTRWSYENTHAEESGQQRVGKKDGSGNNGAARNQGKTQPTDVIGWEWGQTWDAGGAEGPDVYGRVVASGGQVEARSQHAVNTTVVKGTGGFSGSYTVNSKSTTVRVIEENGVVNVYTDGTFRFQASGSPLGDNSYIENISEGGSGTNFNMKFSNVWYYPKVIGAAFLSMLD